ncbi:metabotropic glutamate receptor 1-like [Planococcus citri]|uniref:metabotropic glutamate receptor 1-like n=1 Tax=Planococcus citri TaxID=170843 RepID=UPI0031F923CA
MKNFTHLAILTIAISLRYVKSENDTPSYKIAALLPLLKENPNRVFNADPECLDELQDGALQTVEALYYALDSVERDFRTSSNFTLDAEVFETCGNKLTNINHLYKINADVTRRPKTDPSNSENNSSILAGIVYPNDFGPFDYDRLFKSMKLMHISYTGPSKISFNMEEIESLAAIFSTSGHFFVLDVMFEILAYHQWRHVKLIGPDDFIGYDYQKSNFVRRARELAGAYEICIGHTVSTIQLSANGIYGSELLRYEQASSNTTDVIICYCDGKNIAVLKELLIRENRTKTPAKTVVIAGSTDESWKYGEMTWEPKLGDLYYVTPAMDQYPKAFHDYFTSLSVENFTKHSYLEKFRQRYFKFKTGSNETFNGANTYKTIYKNNSRVFGIIKSVYTIAYGVLGSGHGMFGLAHWTSQPELLRFFLFGQEVSFTQKRFPSMEKFDIYKYQATDNTENRNFIKVAEYQKHRDEDEPSQQERSGVFRIQGNLTVLDEKLFQYSKSHVKSECTEPCPPGQKKTLLRDQCCWNCTPCDDIFEIVDENATSCEKCGIGLMPNSHRNQCIPIQIQLPKDWNEEQNLISIGFSSSSIILAVIISCVFAKYQNTPAVKSTTKELCYIMFAGIILSNITILYSALSLSFKSSSVKTLPAIGFAMVYGALAVKTNRVARLLAIPKRKFANMNLKYVSLNAQITITCILIGVEVIICWIAVQTTNMMQSFDPIDIVLRDYYLHGAFFIEIFSFIALLVLLCTYYAFKTRNVPENFNETKYIGFAMYATVITAIAFSLVYFNTDKKILVTHLCISINSLTILTFLFSHKLYIIFWTPNKNTRVHFSPTSSSVRSYIGKEQRPSIQDTKRQTTIADEKNKQARNFDSGIMTEHRSTSSTKSETDEIITETLL